MSLIIIASLLADVAEASCKPRPCGPPLTGKELAPVYSQRAQSRQPRVAREGEQNEPPPAPEMPAIEGRYYVIHSSLDRDRIREADLRMSKMAEEYHARTKEFSGAIRNKFPFYLFATQEDYLAGGGMKGTAGCFNPNSNVLMAFDAGDAELWHTVQHEGFHQFASAVIGGELPIWVNEGLADYFGEALFTGDSFVVGVIPEWRRKRVVESISSESDEESFKSLEALLRLDHATWNAEMKLANYDQSWSLVHFLVHADDGKYQKPFAAFIRAVSSGRPWERAWQDTIGPASGLEPRWKAFWEALSENPTDDLYAQATTRALTNFLARAQTQKQTFADFETFAKAATKREIKIGDRDWLPAGVLTAAIKDTARLHANGYRFTLALPIIGPASKAKLPQVICTSPEGVERIGRFTLRGGRVAEVIVSTPMETNKTTTRKATSLQKSK